MQRKLIAKLLSANSSTLRLPKRYSYCILRERLHPSCSTLLNEHARIFIDETQCSVVQVLTDPDKRRQYDQGVDPLDPEAQAQQGGGNPFQGGNFQFVFPGGFNPFGGGGGGGGGGGFNPFGGGGGFKFHFGG